MTPGHAVDCRVISFSRRLSPPWALLLALSGLLGTAAHAQFFGRQGPDQYFRSEVQVAASRAAEQKLQRAEADLESGEFAHAVRLVQEVLNDHSDRAIRRDDGRFVSMRRWCNDFLRSLPEEGITVYRKIFDPYAEDLFRRGTKDQDLDLLNDVFLRYQETTFGRAALRTSVSLLLERGRFHELIGAALLFLETWPEATEGPEVLASLGLGARLTGDAQVIAESVRRFGSTWTDRTLQLRGEARNLGEFLEECQSIAEARQAAVPRPRAVPTESFRRPRWERSFQLRTGPSAQVILHDFGRRAGTPRNYLWNPVRPVLDAGTVYLSNGVTVEALGIFSGETKWTHPGNLRPSRSQARPNLEIDFPLVLDRNVLYVSLETPVAPPKTIWTFVPQPSVPHRMLAALDATTGRTIWNHFRGRTVNDAGDQEFIRSLDMAGAPLIIGDNLYIAATRFLTSYQHYLCCFDRRTGRLRWATFICTGQMEQNMFGNRVREAVPGRITEKDGVLWYSTNVGAVAAVDARLGTLRWVVEYDQAPIPQQTRYDPSIHERSPAWADMAPIPLGREIFVAPMDSNELIAVDRFSGRVRKTGIRRTPRNRFQYVLGPFHGTLVVCGSTIVFYDPKTGRIDDPHYDFGSSARRGASYDAGIRGWPVEAEGLLYATVRNRGTDSLMVWDVQRRKLIDELPLGRSSSSSNGPLISNLAAIGEVFVGVATDSSRRRTATIRAWFDADRIRRRLLAELKRDPNNPATHFRLGEFALQGDRPQLGLALESFQSAFDLASRDNGPRDIRNGAREALFQLYVDLAHNEKLARKVLGFTAEACFERALQFARDRSQVVGILFGLLERAAKSTRAGDVVNVEQRILSEHADTPLDDPKTIRRLLPDLRWDGAPPSAGVVALLVTARVMEQRGQAAAAIQRYQQLLRRAPDELVSGKSLWDLSRQAIQELLAKGGRAAYARFDQEAEALLRTARESESLEPLEKILDWYPNSLEVPAAWSLISKRLVAARRLGEVVNRSHEYLSRFNRPDAATISTLAEVLETLGCPDSASEVWRYGLTRFAASKLESGTFAQAAAAALKRLDAAEGAAPLPPLGLNLRRIWQRELPKDGTDWVLITPEGRRPRVMQGHLLVHHSAELLCIDAKTGQDIWTTSCRTPPVRAIRWHDGRLVALMDERIVVLDAKTGADLWSEDLQGREVAALAVSHGKVIVESTPNGYGVDFRLSEFSLIDGTPLREVNYAGAPTPGRLDVSSRWMALPLQSEGATLVLLDILTGDDGGVADTGAVDLQSPILTRNGLVVGLGSRQGAGGSADVELVAIDPANGRRAWRRRIEPGRRRFLELTPDHLIYSSKLGNRTAVTMILLEDGARVFTRRLEPGVTPGAGGVRVTKDDCYVICRETRRDRGVRLFCEDINLRTGLVRWRSLGFNAPLLTLEPFDGGAVLRVLETLRGPGRRGLRRKSTLYILEARTGRIRSDIELSDTSSRLYLDIIRVVDGRLIIADGPKLEAYAP